MPRTPTAQRGTRATRAFGRLGVGALAVGLLGAAFSSAAKLASGVLPSRQFALDVASRVWTSRSTRRIAGLAGAIAVLCGLCWLLQGGLRRHARHQIDPGRIELAAAPSWAKPELAARIKGEIEADLRAELAKLAPSDAFDSDLPEQVHAALARSAWVRSVISVKRRFPVDAQSQSELVPKLEVRTPSLCVATPEAWLLVDADGVRLPLSIKAATDRGQDELNALLAGLTRPIRIVEGVTSSPPAPGKKWESEEIVAALSMERVLRECEMDAVLPIARMRLVGVPAHADARGRVRYAPAGGVVLLPDSNVLPQTQLMWGRPPAHAGMMEPSVNEKLGEIKRLLKEPDTLQGKAIDLASRRQS